MYLTEPQYRRFIDHYNIGRDDPEKSINAKAAAILGASTYYYTPCWDPAGPWVEFEFATPAEETFARLKFGFFG